MSSSDTRDIGTIGEPGMEAGSMKIKDAKDIYLKHGLSLQPDFEALAVVFRKCDIEAPIANSNYLHALSLTDLMFRHADHSLEMVTGGCGDGFIGGDKRNTVKHPGSDLQRQRQGAPRQHYRNNDNQETTPQTLFPELHIIEHCSIFYNSLPERGIMTTNHPFHQCK